MDLQDKARCKWKYGSVQIKVGCKRVSLAVWSRFQSNLHSRSKANGFRGVFFALAVFYDLDIDQIDVKTAFLYGLINQLVYVEIPKRIETEANQNMVCQLLKALYGRKQFPRL